jgi:hypothetical protein
MYRRYIWFLMAILCSPLVPDTAQAGEGGGQMRDPFLYTDPRVRPDGSPDFSNLPPLMETGGCGEATVRYHARRPSPHREGLRPELRAPGTPDTEAEESYPGPAAPISPESPENG